MAHRQGIMATDELIGGIAARRGVTSAFTATLHDGGCDSFAARKPVSWWRRLRRSGAGVSMTDSGAPKSQV